MHGASLVGEAIRGSTRVNEMFDCRYINLSTSESIADIGRWSLRKLRTMTSLRRRVRRALSEFRPDWVYMTPAARGLGFKKDYLLARMIKRRGFKLVVHFHNKGVASASDPLSRLLYRDFFRGVSVIQLSRTLYPDIREYVAPEQVYVCPNGIMDTAASFALRRDNPVCHILYLSHLQVAKGILDLLDACRILREAGGRFVLDIAGGPSGEISPERLSDEISSRGLTDVCNCLGWVDGPSKEQAFRQADIFVFPTQYEAFGLVALEAMMYRLPVVATDEGSLREIVADGESGLIVPRCDASALAEALGRLLSDAPLRERMGAAGRARFEQSFTEEAFLQRFVEILRQL